MQNKHTNHEYSFLELYDAVIVWADDRGIFEKATPLTQLSKTQEELDETIEATEYFMKHDDKIMDVVDGVGDITVTLIILCEMLGIDFVDCLRYAYYQIKDRKGEMVDGLFVKENEEIINLEYKDN